MMSDGYKPFETLLQEDKNPKFIQFWNSSSQRFGKKNLFEALQSTYVTYKEDISGNNYASDEERERSFRDRSDAMIRALQIKKGRSNLHLKRDAYGELKSLFGKYIYIVERQGKDLLQNFQPPKVVGSEPQTVQNDLFDNLGTENTVFLHDTNKEGQSYTTISEQERSILQSIANSRESYNPDEEIGDSQERHYTLQQRRNTRVDNGVKNTVNQYFPSIVEILMRKGLQENEDTIRNAFTTLVDNFFFEENAGYDILYDKYTIFLNQMFNH